MRKIRPITACLPPRRGLGENLWLIDTTDLIRRMTAMPMELLRSLCEGPLPVDITDAEAWPKLLVLQQAELISANVPPPRSLAHGKLVYGTATVLSVTAAGCRAAGARNRPGKSTI